ncbi:MULTISPECIES: 3'(2'),5'-bisphosphate nucleotidase CysQ [unclassified Fusibacter]|uniref:3'(2'),5'-bisphosphate nucleotidase CysQ family protein n=1 Tax=unclassified Fusibacter TaxID=2624464 RepID=UPI0013E99448|nr:MULTISPECIES: 3'(2'),5'-bisphosphate nucleotidase CysQ [unclassified Fusibacter]MCK8061426.1 3'(2'),5'-bisphosphate nucleotidase CysQ [Fusibacter sp. A2]NPE23613.1 3'(2'),5'-bisphosphate nucleotidase CysQ [Fusibacter sp. A1]
MKWTVEQIREICENASEIIMSYYKTDLKISSKEDDTPVTVADKASDKLIRAALKLLEDIPILSEETLDTKERLKASRIWLVDPLDGTKDFIGKTDEFAINIALIENRRPVFGAIYIPVKKEFYYAFKGQGAFMHKDGTTTGIHVSERIEDLRLLKSRFYKSGRHEAIEIKYGHLIEAVHAAGSCYKGCLIAKGEGECYFRYGLTSEWDTAPMDLIVHEAGGIVRQMDGTLFEYNREDTINRIGFYVVNNKKNILDAQERL